MMHIKWEKYYTKTAERPPRDLLVESLRYVKERGVALDVGAGALIDSKHLLKEGFAKVIAIDADPAFVAYAEKINDPHFEYEYISVLDFPFEEGTYDVINAQRVFPYLREHEFKEALEKVTMGLKQGGIFAGVFFGERDEQILPDYIKITKVTADELRAAFVGFEIIKFIEEEKEGESTMGKPKHQHELSIIARKL